MVNVMAKSSMIRKLYKYRFEFFFFSLLGVLFGSLIFPLALFEKVVMPIILLINVITGILLISKKKKLAMFFALLLTVVLGVYGTEVVSRPKDINTIRFLQFGTYFLFYVIVTIEIIRQVWNTQKVNKNVIFGLMSGYIALGLVAFFIFLTIEIATPGSFGGILLDSVSIAEKTDTLLYYSYITLLTIGYGEVIPITPTAQKAAILTGLMGQFYIVIITAVVVEKYIRHSVKNEIKNE